MSMPSLGGGMAPIGITGRGYPVVLENCIRVKLHQSLDVTRITCEWGGVRTEMYLTIPSAA